MGKRNNTCIFALPSLTYAMRANELLKNYGIYSRVVSLDPSITKKGCAHGIETECRNNLKTKNILLDQNIPISEITGV